MKKFLSLLFSLFLLGMSLAPASARVPAKVVTGLRTLPLKTSELSRRFPSFRFFSPSSQIILPGRYFSKAVLRANNIRLPVPQTALGRGASISASVQGALSENVGIDVTSLTLTDKQAIKLLDDVLEQGWVAVASGLALSDPVLSVAPHLWVERGFSRTPQQNAWALQNYRARLNKPINPSAKMTRQRSEWASQMAAVANLGFLGSEKDVPAMLQAYENVPEKFKPYTEVIVGRALLALGDTEALTRLASLCMKDGELAGEFWAGVKEYAEETGLALELPQIKEGTSLPALASTDLNSLKSFNALNALHANPGADATREWITLNEKKGVLLPEEAPAQTPRPSGGREQAAPSVPLQTVTPEIPAETVQHVQPQNAATPISTEISQRLHSPGFARGLFISPAPGSQQEGGVLGIFCREKRITFQGRPFEAIQEAAQYRDDLIQMLENNDQDIVNQAFKGMTEERLKILRRNFPSSKNRDGGGLSRAAAEKIANLVLGLADPVRAAKLTKIASNGYLFLDYDNALTFSLKTEVTVTSREELSRIIPASEKADFISIFNRTVGQHPSTPLPPTDPGIIKAEVFPQRYFRFTNPTAEVTFDNLPAFLRANPQANFNQTAKKTLVTRRTSQGEIEHPELSRIQNQEPELRELEKVLRSPGNTGTYVLNKHTINENLTALNALLQRVKQEVPGYLHSMYPDANPALFKATIRMGEDEVSSGVSSVSLSNIHAHVETLIPDMDFGVTFTLPIRVSYTMKQDIIKQYEDWVEAGELGSSFLESFTPAPVQAPPSPVTTARPARQTESSAAADYDDMLPDGLIPVFAY